MNTPTPARYATVFEILVALRLTCEELTTQHPPHSPSDSKAPYAVMICPLKTSPCQYSHIKFKLFVEVTVFIIQRLFYNLWVNCKSRCKLEFLQQKSFSISIYKAAREKNRKIQREVTGFLNLERTHCIVSRN